MKFVDTSFWVALLIPRDRRHAEANKIWESDPGALLSTNHVVGETWTYLRRRTGHAIAVEFLDAAADTDRLTVEHVTDAQEVEAQRWLRRHDEREYSFVDATSFVVMRSSRLPEALAFDGDFAAAGFIETRVST